jgi:hypothetical protein
VEEIWGQHQNKSGEFISYPANNVVALRDVAILAISAGASSTAGAYTSEGKSGVIEEKR